MKYTQMLISLLISSAFACTTVKEYDARTGKDEILTPTPLPSPTLNNTAIYGCSPGKPVIYRIPTQGTRPIHFSAMGLPAGVVLDAASGILKGTAPLEKGHYEIELRAENQFGKAAKTLTLVVGDTLALTPPMGWNHWYTHYHHVTQEIIEDAASTMVSSGMADVGYSFVSIDDCWMRLTPESAQRSLNKRRTASVGLDLEATVGEVRDEEGRILPNENFPDMNALTKHIHQLGLKAGIYSSPGPITCQEFEGSWQHEAIDAATYAEWGFDLLKYDWCGYRQIYRPLPVTQKTIEARKKPFVLMGDLLKAQNRDIIHNLNGKVDEWIWGGEAGHSWRIGGDLGHTITEGGIYRVAEKNIGLRSFNGPGGWNDPDYLIMGKWRSPFNKGADLTPIVLTTNEQYSYMSLWCLMASPLFFSGDMGSLDAFIINILCNNEMIAVNQDRMGVCAEPARMDEYAWILKKPMSDGSLVIGFFDIANEGDQTISVTWDELGISGPCHTRDLWRHLDIGRSNQQINVQVGPLGCAVLKLTHARL